MEVIYRIVIAFSWYILPILSGIRHFQNKPSMYQFLNFFAIS